MRMNLALLVVFLDCLTSVVGVPQLLFANRREICLVDAGSPSDNGTVVVDDLEDAAAVDFLFREQIIFWTDVTLEMIKSRRITGSRSDIKDVITTGLVSPDGLACDWLGNKIYWTDSETNRIEVSNLDGTYRKVLFWSNLDQPRAIALDPHNGFMYWTDWGEQPKIERAGMDGSSQSRQVIVDSDIYWPNGLTIDYQDDKIFWADAKNSFIHSCNLDGTERRSVVQDGLPHPFALTLFQNSLYWTDWQTQAIHTCDKRTGAELRVVHNQIWSPMDIHVFHPSRQATGNNPCGDNNGGCSHLCLMSPRPPYYSCACPTGVRLGQDNMTCADGASELLLLVRRTDLRRISLDTPDYTDVVIQVDNIQHAIAVDYDPVDGMVYWTDDEVRSIRRANLDGSNQESIVTSEVEHPDGVAVDWIARNLYWTDTGTDRIEVARLNGTSRKVIVSEKLEEPRAIALDPAAGLLYWTDWGKNPKIERACLDGSNRTVLVNTSLGWPNGLAIDYAHGKIYWGDAEVDRIEVADVDGSNRHTLVSKESDIPHIFGFSLLGDYIYWTDWQRRSIERINKHTGAERQIIIEQLPDLMGLKAVDVHRIEGSNPCALNNGNCSHLCLHRPQGHVCACPMGLELLANAHTCIIPEAFLLFSHRTDIRRISIETSHNNVIIPLSGVKDANALDFDINDHRIYWTDITLKVISRAFMNGSAHEDVVQFGLEYPEGMAVDWVAHNLYWADVGTQRIEMARMDGSSRRVLVWRNIEPRTIALDPPRGYMYWCNWGDVSRIERAALDGTQRAVLITGEERMNGLTIDFSENRLYWINVDSLSIESTDLDGSNRLQVVQGLSSPFGLTQYLDFIYWTDWKTQSIEKANKSTGLNRSRIQDHLDNIMDISVFHASRQSGWNTCNSHNGGCTHLCVAHSLDYPSNMTHHCECPTHYSLHEDEVSCRAPDAFMLYSQKNSISRMLMDTDLAPTIVLPIPGLRNIKSLAFDPVDQLIYWIDGRSKTIKRASDEGSGMMTVVSHVNLQQPFSLAIDPYTRHIYWSDQSQNVINVTKLDGTPVGVIVEVIKQQEQQKPRHIALAPKHGLIFWTNLVYPAKIERAAMDGTEQVTIFGLVLESPCAITVDEDAQRLYWADSVLKRIESGDFEGGNRKVLSDLQVSEVVGLAVSGEHLYWVDRGHNLLQVIDKATGRNVVKLQGRLTQLTSIVAVQPLTISDREEMACGVDNGGCTHLCVHEKGGSEKRCSCPIGLQLGTDMAMCVDPPTCGPAEFMCDSGATRCIPAIWRCDGRPECTDQSDEENCPECASQEFKCDSGRCISKKLRCDGRLSCDDGSDEKMCAPCGENYFECTSDRTCILGTSECDGKYDCSGGEDEIDCVNVNGQLPHRADSATAQYTISFVVGCLVVLGVLFIVVFACRKRGQNHLMMDSNQVLMVSPSNGKVVAIPTPPNTLISETSAGTLGHKLPSSSGSGPPYDRNHVTGASSSSSAVTHYPKETLNPPPSPITDRSLCGDTTAGEDVYFTPMSSGVVGALPPPRHSHRHHRRRHIPPMPTPASTTDVCEESEPLFCHNSLRHTTTPNPHSHYYQTPYDSNPFCPPPPTPHSQYLSDEMSECPPSPSTERSFFNPYPPPPSPAANHSDC